MARPGPRAGTRRPRAASGEATWAGRDDGRAGAAPPAAGTPPWSRTPWRGRTGSPRGGPG